MHGFLHDLKIGARALVAARSTTFAAVLILALGTGVNTSVLAVAYGILLRPLPYPDASRIVALWVEVDGREFGAPISEFDEWRARLRTVESLAACSNAEFTVSGAGEPRVVRGAVVKGDFFKVLGVSPVAGHAPSASDDGWVVLGRRNAALVGAADERAVGRALTVGQGVYTVAAIMPPPFAFPADDVAVWVPSSSITAVGIGGERRDGRSFRLIARLKPGVTIEQASGDATRVLHEIRGRQGREVRLTVRPLTEVLTGGVRPALTILSGAAILVLLVACGNVASLLVGRAVARSHDVAVRLALGASRWQLMRAVLAESLIVAVAASAAGVWIALVLVRLFVRVATGVLPRLDDVAIDLPVLALSTLAALVIAVLCGAAPALHAARSDFAQAFRGVSASSSRRAGRVRAVLVAVQIALSIVLLTGAALVSQTVARLVEQAGGIQAKRVTTARLVMTPTTTFGAAEKAPFVSRLLERVRALPGVQAAGMGSTLPPRMSPLQLGITVQSERGQRRFQALTLASVTPGYFQALGARVLRGRAFEDADIGRGEAVAVLSESAARHLSPHREIVNTTLSFSLPPIAGRARRPRIVGVVGDIKYAGLDSSSTGTIYLLWNSLPAGTCYLVARASQDPAVLGPALQRAVRETDAAIPVPEIRLLEDEILRSIADRRLRVVPAVSFACLALVVALVGLAAVIARAVADRRRELAIRGALGATPAGNVRMIVSEGARWSVIGLLLGLGAAAAVGRTLATLLYGVSPYDPLTFGAIAVLVALGAILTCYLAARRALRIDLIELLRTP